MKNSFFSTFSPLPLSNTQAPTDKKLNGKQVSEWYEHRLPPRLRGWLFARKRTEAAATGGEIPGRKGRTFP
ncbi:protein of unknown function [Pseudodesulfovibrio piezophilus C1TLV30]|uniref:Uncharacterized protein n=1 Tax=Pseudodesulfovibrio piezophilus (strain DSM 21447 / JCM 15486 / C1TLV30) TaxID=1322246 RepID=M1WXC8_PSEP2|nr:protein of unknown function [Pseudodesulfovibrio piezophilus C1TLV30]